MQYECRRTGFRFSFQRAAAWAACFLAAATLRSSAEPGATVVSVRPLVLSAETPLGRATISSPAGAALETSGIAGETARVWQGAFSANVPRTDVALPATAVSETSPPAATPASLQPPAPQGATAAPGNNNGFAGVPFGATVEEARQKWQLEKLEPASAPDDPVATFLREEESLVLGGAVVREVVYYFVNGKFYAVAFVTPDRRQTVIMRDALTLSRGAPVSQDESGTSLVWPGRPSSAQMVANPANGEARVLIFGNAQQEDYEKSLQSAAAKTATGL